MPSGVYVRTEEMKRNISKGLKGKNKGTIEEKEIEIQKAIKDALQYMANQGRLMFLRIQAGGYPTKEGHFIKLNKGGSPDILVWKRVSDVNGNKRFHYLKTVAFEVKSTRGKQTELQKEWQDKFEELGGEYHIVRSVDDVMRILLYLDT